MQKAVGRERELTRTSEFMRHIFVHPGQMSSRLGQGGLTWRGQLETQVGTTGRGDTAETSPLMPNPTALRPCCYFPIHYYPPRPAHTPPPPGSLPRCRQLDSLSSYLFPATLPSTQPSPTLVLLSPCPAGGLVPGGNAAGTPRLLTCHLPSKSALRMGQADPQAAWSREQHVDFQKENSKKKKKF